MVIKNNKYKRKEKTKQNHKVFMNFSRTFNLFPMGNFAEKHTVKPVL